MEGILLSPPVAFIIFLLMCMGLSLLTRRLGARGRDSKGKEKAYACGQDTEVNKIQPDYREFFPYAFFFTIMHTMVLVIATMPADAIWSALFYIVVALLSLRILLRK
jgi:NADH:ubiquinone oxidoreductase subunit 3 (subunit A)